MAMGVDAVEPDVVVSKDGVLVVRHENDITATTDISDRPEFADRRRSALVDGVRHEGWFTEDFTWAELATLRCRERLPEVRTTSASFDDTQPVLRLRDVLEMVRLGSLEHGREIGVVLEIKHATYYAAHGWDLGVLVAAEVRAAGWHDGSLPLIVESFESTVLRAVRAAEVVASFVYLLEAKGKPADLLASLGKAAPTYAAQASPRGLDALVGEVDGISVNKSMILGPDLLGRITGPTRVVADAHERGLRVFTWTARPENRFLVRQARTSPDPAAYGDYEAEWEVLRAAGVDGVFADHPDLAAAFYRTGRGGGST